MSDDIVPKNLKCGPILGTNPVYKEKCKYKILFISTNNICHNISYLHLEITQSIIRISNKHFKCVYSLNCQAVK